MGERQKKGTHPLLFLYLCLGGRSFLLIYNLIYLSPAINTEMEEERLTAPPGLLYFLFVIDGGFVFINVISPAVCMTKENTEKTKESQRSFFLIVFLCGHRLLFIFCPQRRLRK